MNNDLISREVLRKNMEFVCMGIMAGTEPYNAPLTEIDNAPTVPLPDFKEGYKQAIIDGKTNFSRPQGEWVYDNKLNNWKCSECRETPKTIGYVGTRDFMNEHFKYCNHCGADMKGGAK